MAKLKGVVKAPEAPAEEQEEETPGQEEAAAVEEAEGAEGTDPEEEKVDSKEYKRLQRENEELREKAEARRDPPPAEQPKVTVAWLEALDEEQREAVEKQAGMPFTKVMATVRAQEADSRRKSDVAQHARLSVREAIEDAVDADPQVAKLKGHIKDYLADITDEQKADPARLKVLMKKAVTYAKGAAGVTVRTGKPKVDPKGPRPDDEPAFSEDDDDIKPGVYDFKNGLRIRIEDKIPPKRRAQIKHPEQKYGVILPASLDEEPRFR